MIGNEWEDHELVKDAKDMVRRAWSDAKAANVFNTLGHAALRIEKQISAYDAGFEAGVLATEAGLGRADN